MGQLKFGREGSFIFLGNSPCPVAYAPLSADPDDLGAAGHWQGLFF